MGAYVGVNVEGGKVGPPTKVSAEKLEGAPVKTPVASVASRVSVAVFGSPF